MAGPIKLEKEMKRIVLLITLVALAFYAAWPAYSLYVLSNGLQDKDISVIEKKVAWVPLRASLKDPVTSLVRKEIDKQSKGSGIEGAIAGQVANEMAPQLVDQILDSYVTPKGVITLVNQGGKIDVGNLGIGNLVSGYKGSDKDDGFLGGLIGKAKDVISSIPGGKDLLSTGLGKIGKTLGETIDEEASSQSPTKTTYGLDNIKHFKFIDPWSFEVGIAKSPTATKPDLIAGMSFIDRDWKLSKLVPSF